MSQDEEVSFVTRYKERFDLKLDSDWSYRTARLYILGKFYNSTIYDCLQPFHSEFTDGSDTGKYVPLAKRRPSVIYKLPKIIVDASVSMLFGEGHFPVIRCEDKKHEKTTQFLQWVTRKCNLKNVMISAAKKGSVGSVVVLVKILDGKFYFESLESCHLLPVFKRMQPESLEKLTQKKKVDGDSLRTQGYFIDEDDSKENFFIIREWTETEEIYYQPYKEAKDSDPDFYPVRDDDRSTLHELDFVPAVWIKNLPSDGIDGHGTFEDILDICIENDYQWSQHGRLLRYSSDPTLVIKNSTSMEGDQLIKGIDALKLDENGEAYYLEITTGATKSVMEYVKGLREIALEIVRGNRGSPDKSHGAQSGEALKLLHYELVSLVEEMRLTYGDWGLLQVYGMILKMAFNKKLKIEFGEFAPTDGSAECVDHLMLDWPAWYPPSALEKFNEAQTFEKLIASGIISKQTATKSVADEYNILDVEAEIKQVDADSEEMYANEAALKTAKPAVAPQA